jgi:hypothetical protein
MTTCVTPVPTYNSYRHWRHAVWQSPIPPRRRSTRPILRFNHSFAARKDRRSAVHFRRTPSRTAHFAHKSAEGREHLCVRREPAARLLGIREPAIHRNLEHAAAGPLQLHLRAGCGLLNQTCRHTGARFIASHSAIFDLNLHELLSRLSLRLG